MGPLASCSMARVLCLYQAPETEWKPSDGMFGFIERLYTWVKQAAVNQLDPVGAPLHPPVAYVSSSSGPLVVPYANTPAVKNDPWLGFGHIRQRSDDRIDVVGWCGLDETPTSGAVAAGILLPQAASFEFPKQVRDLLSMLEGQGISRSALIKTLGGAAAINGKDTQLLVLIGTPTRGIRESGEYPQHLVAWLHLLNPPALIDDFLQGSPAPQVQGDEAAGKLGDAVLEAASLAQPAEDLEGLSVLVR